MKTFPTALRLNTPVHLVTGADDSLAAINTNPLPDGALCFVTEAEAIYQLRKASTATADGSNIVAPAEGGPGRWYFYGPGGAYLQQLDVFHEIIPPQSSVDSAVAVLGVASDADIVVANLLGTGLIAGVAVGPIRVTGANAATFRFTNATAASVVAGTVSFRAMVL